MAKLYTTQDSKTFGTKPLLAAALHLYGKPFAYADLKYKAAIALREMARETPSNTPLQQEVAALVGPLLRIAAYVGTDDPAKPNYILSLMRESPDEPFRVSTRNVERMSMPPSRIGVLFRWPSTITVSEMGSVAPTPILINPTVKTLDFSTFETRLQLDRATRLQRLLSRYRTKPEFSVWFAKGKAVLKQTADQEVFPRQFSIVRIRQHDTLPEIRDTVKFIGNVPGKSLPIYNGDSNAVLLSIPQAMIEGPGSDAPVLVQEALSLLLHPYIGIQTEHGACVVYAPHVANKYIHVVRIKAYSRAPSKIPIYQRHKKKWVPNTAAVLDIVNIAIYSEARIPYLEDFFFHLKEDFTYETLSHMIQQHRIELTDTERSLLQENFGPALKAKPAEVEDEPDDEE